MHQRILPWLLLCAFFAAISVRAQTPASGTPTVVGGAELVLVAKKVGTVKMTLNGVVTELVQDAKVPQKAKINTMADSSVVLVFSNGATTQLGADTELIIEEYLQDPFANTVKVAELENEPSQSRTKLVLNRGELVGNVKHLKYDKGSSFIIQTPVGAAGIRGTTFRIVFRPNGTGQAFFNLSTAIGNVAFEQPNSSGQNPQGQQPQPTVTGKGTAAVAVPQGQEIVITIDVTTNAQGQVVITTPATVAPTTVAIPQETLQKVSAAATEIAVAVQQAVFTPPPPAPTTSGGGSGTPPASGNTDSNTGGGNSNTGGGDKGTTGTTGSTQKGGTTGSTTTTTTNVSGQNFSGTVTTTQPPAATPPRIVPTNPNP